MNIEYEKIARDIYKTLGMKIYRSLLNKYYVVIFYFSKYY